MGSSNRPEGWEVAIVVERRHDRLAASARADYAAAIADNPTLARERDEIDSWLTAHPLP